MKDEGAFEFILHPSAFNCGIRPLASWPFLCYISLLSGNAANPTRGGAVW
jgi:hypothetical protein